jgi:hypothetical protein
LQSTLVILKWAAGCPVELPSGCDVTDGDLMVLLAKHRLVERFLFRLEQRGGRPRFPDGRPSWCSPALIANLATRRAKTRVHFWQQCEAIHEIVHALDTRTRSLYPWPVVIFKGFAAYALTGELHHMHDSGDIDILCESPDEFRSVAEDLGYSVVNHDRVMHEDKTFARAGVVIELHKYIETVSYPHDASSACYAPARNPGCWWQRSGMFRRNRSLYEEVVWHCTGGVASGTVGLGITNTTLSVANLCAHALRDYVYPCELFPVPVRLGELADILDLCRLSSFEPPLLQQVAARMDALDSIEFAACLIGEYFGVNPFDGTASRGFWFPRTVTYDGGWACVNAVEDVLFPLDTTAVIDRLECNVVQASGDRMHIATGGAPIDGAYQGRGRMIICSVRGQPVQVDLTAGWDDDKLLFELFMEEADQAAHLITLRSPFADISAGVSVHFDTRFTAHSHFDRVSVGTTLDGNGCKVRLGIPRTVLAQAFGNRPHYHFLLSLERWAPGIAIRSCRPDPCVLIPIKAEAMRRPLNC